MPKPIELTDDDFAIINGRSATAVFMNSLAGALHSLEERPDGAAVQDFLLTALLNNLRGMASTRAPRPMTPQEREKLKQLYRVFVGFYRDPTALANLPEDSTQH